MRWLILALGLIAGSVMPGWANPEDASVRVEEVLRLLAEGFEEHLTALGYDAGPSDGVLDSQTEAAVRAFEADHGLPITGKMSGEIQSVVYQRARDDPTAAAHLCESLYQKSKSALAWQWCGILAQQGDVETIVSVASTLWRISAYMQDDPYIFIDVWRLYESAAEKNDPDSQYWLADRYRSNDDWIEAARWARMAAEQGHEYAQLMIGRLYYEGKGVPQNYTESAKWLSPLADRGWVSAQVILGDLYLRGQGVSQDYVTAHMWLNLAAAQGNDAAREARDLVAENMTIAEIAEAQRRALEWQPMPER